MTNITGHLNDSLGSGNYSMEAAHRTCATFDFFIEAVIMGLMCLFGFTGNTLSMICLNRDKSKTATPLLLISLEVADTVFLVTVLFLRVIPSIREFTGWLVTVDVVMPYIVIYLWPVAMIASMATNYLTMLVTMNRYISVCRPYEASELCSVRYARVHVAIVAVLSIIYNLPRFFEYQVSEEYYQDINETKARSVPTPMSTNVYYQVIYLNALYLLVMFLVPLATLMLLNYKLIVALRNAKRKRAQLLKNSDRDKLSHSRSEDDITLVLIVVVVVFVVCQSPALVTQCLITLLPSSCATPFFFYVRISDMFMVANSAINFIIYCFCSRKFRSILISLLCQQTPNSATRNQATTLMPRSKASHLENAATNVVRHNDINDSLV